MHISMKGMGHHVRELLRVNLGKLRRAPLLREAHLQGAINCGEHLSLYYVYIYVVYMCIYICI